MKIYMLLFHVADRTEKDILPQNFSFQVMRNKHPGVKRMRFVRENANGSYGVGFSDCLGGGHSGGSPADDEIIVFHIKKVYHTHRVEKKKSPQDYESPVGLRPTAYAGA